MPGSLTGAGEGRRDRRGGGVERANSSNASGAEKLQTKLLLFWRGLDVLILPSALRNHPPDCLIHRVVLPDRAFVLTTLCRYWVWTVHKSP